MHPAPKRPRPFALLALLSLASACAPARWVGDGPGESAVYRVRGRSTLLDVAHHYRLGYVEVVAANPGVDPWLPRSGTEVLLPTLHLPPSGERDGIVINLGDMRLYHFVRGQPMRSYPIGIGREGLTTPLGRTSIVRKEANPVWRPTARMRREDPTLPAEVPPGPDNPMGAYALYLAVRPYAIHGTNKQLGIGRRVSSGCIRLYADDIGHLFADTPIGTKVRVVDEPVKVAWYRGELYMEAHPTQQQAIALESGKAIESKMSEAIAVQVRREAIEAAERVDWELVDRIATERRGYALRITRPEPGAVAP